MRRPRWIAPWRRARAVLGLNGRNLLYVHGLNPRRHFPLADDKVLTKRVLAEAGVPVPETLVVLSNLAEVSHARERLQGTGEFVIKPAHGRQGSGIVVVTAQEEGRFVRIDGVRIDWEQLRRTMGDILFGVYSSGRADRVIVERRIRAHAALGDLAASGLPDLRLILLRGRPAMAMLRVATRASGGRANLHQGALGVGLRLADGSAVRCVCRGRSVETHPDNGRPVIGFRVPLWHGVLDVARRAARALPLPYLGVDVVLDATVGPMVMEVNARPGLEIQNVNGRGLRRTLARLAAGAEGAS